MGEFRWTERDRFGNEIYLTDERWEHIIGPANHPEMEGYEFELRETIRLGSRKQEMLDPQKYRYSRAFDELTASNTHCRRGSRVEDDSGNGTEQFHRDGLSEKGMVTV